MGRRVVSVNVGLPREIEWLGRRATTSIWKEPVEGRVEVAGVNLAGDDQADRNFHGGPDKAVYAYAREDSSWWEDVLGIDVSDGMFGENLTTEGVDVSGAVIGERWRIGTVEFEVCQPRQPCSKLGIRFENPKMVKMFAQSSRPGAYLRIIQEGEIGAGDEIEVIHRPEHGITIAMVSDAVFKDRSLAERVLAAPQLSEEAAADLRAQAA
jgi:MOSC domain-containing protein YiiM